MGTLDFPLKLIHVTLHCKRYRRTFILRHTWDGQGCFIFPHGNFHVQTQSSPRQACLIVQVYAYTSSALQAAILRLFVRCECVLPNLFVGVLTRESVTSALACGLSADQIVAFLRKHAHPHVAQRVPVVPEARPRPQQCCFRVLAHSRQQARAPARRAARARGA